MAKYRIKELRKRCGMTQDALSKESGVSRATIWALESGKDKVTTTKTLDALAKCLNVEMDELFLVRND